MGCRRQRPPAGRRKVLSFWQAKTEAQKLAGRKLDASIMTATDDGAPVTLDEALKQYGAALLERGARVRNAPCRATICPTRCCRSRSR